MRRIVAVVFALLMIAGCASDNGDTVSSTSSPPEQTSTSAATPPEGGRGNDWVTVDTAGSGCTPQIKPGDCWLPLYPTPAYVGTPLNLQTEASPQATCLKEAQANCWPQPNKDRLQAICQVQASDGTMWLGVFVENARVLTPSSNATLVEGGAIGYAEAQWFDIGDAALAGTCA